MKTSLPSKVYKSNIIISLVMPRSKKSIHAANLYFEAAYSSITFLQAQHSMCSSWFEKHCRALHSVTHCKGGPYHLPTVGRTRSAYLTHRRFHLIHYIYKNLNGSHLQTYIVFLLKLIKFIYLLSFELLILVKWI